VKANFTDNRHHLTGDMFALFVSL